MQDILGVQVEVVVGAASVVHAVPQRRNLSIGQNVRLCSLLSAYRLLDVLAMVKGSPRAQIVAQQTIYPIEKSLYASPLFTSFAVSLKFSQGMNKLANWPDLLFDFRKCFEKSAVTSTISDNPSMESAPLRLLRMISHTRATAKYASVESNFLFAAMHVACMKELPFLPDVLPDLPDKYDKFLDA